MLLSIKQSWVLDFFNTLFNKAHVWFLNSVSAQSYCKLFTNKCINTGHELNTNSLFCYTLIPFKNLLAFNISH